MKRLVVLAAVLLSASGAHAAGAVLTYVASRDLVVAAQPGAKTTAFRADTATKVWTLDGVEAPRIIAQGPDRLLVVDSFHSEVMLLGLTEKTSRRFAVASTPVAAAFAGKDPFVLSRDGRRLQRLGADGVDEEIETPHDAVFLGVANGRLYVYGRTSGVLIELQPRPLRVTRRVEVPPFASDMEADDRAIYLLYPRMGTISVVLLRDFRIDSEPVGAVPVDAAIEGNRTTITAGSLVVADPSSKRIWRSERLQSFRAAVGRGFIRGLLGLGLYRPSSPQFPTGVDRVVVDRYARLAYDSTAGSLFRFDGKKPRLLARDLAPGEFAATPDGVAVWDSDAESVVFRK